MTNMVLYPVPSHNPRVVGPPASRIVGGLVAFQAAATNAPAAQAVATVVAGDVDASIQVNAITATVVAVASATANVQPNAATSAVSVRNNLTCMAYPGSGTLPSTPDHTSLTLTDLDVRMNLAIENWASSFTMWIFSQGDHVVTQDLAWALSIHSNGRFRTAIGTGTGNAFFGAEADAATGFAAWSTHLVRSTVDVNNGAGDSVFNYQESTNGGATWNSIGTADLLGGQSATMRDSAQPLTIPGTFPDGKRMKFYYAELRSTINGTIVANPDFTSLTPGDTSVVDSTGKTWTFNAGSIVPATDAEVSVNAQTATVTALASGQAANVQPSAAQAVVSARAQHSYLNLPGGSGNYVSTPDHSSLDITGDIDIRVDIAIYGADGGSPAYVSKFAASNHSYVLDFANTVLGDWPRLLWSTNGTADVAIGGFPNVAASYGANYTRHGVRATLDVVDGSNHTGKVYDAPEIDGTWTERYTTSPAGNTSIFSGSAPVEIGSHTGGTLSVMKGRFYALQIRNGIDGTIVADPRFDTQLPGTTSVTDSTGKVWTLNGTASILALGPTSSVSANAQTATVVAVANNATVTTSGAANAAAQTATVVAVSIDIDASIQTNAAQSIVNALANNATITTTVAEALTKPVLVTSTAEKTSQKLHRQPAFAFIDFGSVSVEQDTNANAQTATVSVLANSIDASIQVNAAQAVVLAIANNATISTASFTNASAQTAVVTAIANNVVASIGPGPNAAIVSALANNTSAQIARGAVAAVVISSAINATIAFARDANATTATVTTTPGDTDASIGANAIQAIVNPVANNPTIQVAGQQNITPETIITSISFKVPVVINLALDPYPIEVDYTDFDYSIEVTAPSYDVSGAEGAGTVAFVEVANTVEYTADYRISGSTPTYEIDFTEG